MTGWCEKRGGGEDSRSFKSALIYRWKRKWGRELRSSAFAFDLVFNNRGEEPGRLIERRPLWIGHRGIVWRKDASGASNTSDVAANRCLDTSSVLVLIHCPYLTRLSRFNFILSPDIADYCPTSHPTLGFVVLENPHIIKYYDCRYFSRLFIDISCERRFICEISEKLIWTSFAF